MVAAILLFSSHGRSQILPFQSYSVKDGLLSSGISTIYQDTRGYLWIGTRDGVSVFDGWTFTNFTTNDGLRPGGIKQILDDPQREAIWVLTSRGVLSRFANGKPGLVIDGPATHGHPITCLARGNSSTIWIGTVGSLACLDGDSVRYIDTGFPLEVDALSVQGDSILWIVAREGVWKYGLQDSRMEKVDVGVDSPLFAFGTHFDEDGTVWLGLSGVIVQLRDGKVVTRWDAPGALCLADDSQGNLWYASYDGLFRVRKTELAAQPFDHFTVENGLPENTLRTVFVDRELNLWVGGIKKGVARLSEPGTLRFEIPGVNPPYQYSVAAADSNGHIWLASPAGLWEVYEDNAGWWHSTRADDRAGRGRPFSYPGIQAPDRTSIPFSVVLDDEGRLWVGYANGQLACYSLEARPGEASKLRLERTLRPGVDLPAEFPGCFIVDRPGRVWLVNRGIVLLDPAHVRPLQRRFTEREGVPSVKDYVRTLMCDSRGNIWAGSFASGVVRLDADSISHGLFHPVRLPAPAGGSRIASIREDGNGRIWIASESHGLFIIDGQHAVVRSTADGLPSGIVTSTTEDRRGRVWVSTAVGGGYFDNAGSTYFRKRDDLSDAYVFASGTTTRGALWFVTIDGLIIHRPSLTAPVAAAPDPMITTVRANGVELPVAGDLSLDYGQNNLEFSFVAISFRNQKDIRYQYRLWGLETGWSTPRTTRQVTYGAVPPGSYRFEVRVVDARGGSHADIAEINISIIPPFWKTGWFSMLSWVMGIGLIGATIRYVEISNVRRRMRALEQQRALEQERLRISSDLHDELASNLTSIAMLSNILHEGRKNGGAATAQDGHALDRIAELSSQSVQSIRDIIWAIDPKSETLAGLMTRLRDTLVTICRARGIELACDLSGVTELPVGNLQPEVRRNLWLLLREAAHNAVKHAECTRLEISAHHTDGMLEIVVRDNGRGYDAARVHSGKGLRTMEMRARQIGGVLERSGVPGKGTAVVLRLTINNRTD